MQLVILHYHLNRGGVTSVVENHLRSLALLDPVELPARVAILYGGRSAAWNEQLAQELPFECELVAVPELEYDHLRSPYGQLPDGQLPDGQLPDGQLPDGQLPDGQLFDALQTVLHDFDPEATVLHVHNHSLGKNAEMASLVCRLAEAGWRLLLQIHDFAEDLRPTNYQHLLRKADSVEQLREQLYPQAAQIHYAVLNQRDQQILMQAGINDEHLHLLPNPVKALPQLPESKQREACQAELAQALNLPPGNRLVLYPVRPIRRKNLGELLLWSLLVEDATFALTLAPLNPQEQATYQRWVEFVAELQLAVQFEVGTKTNLRFEEVYAAADAIITTSVAEGFGMVYLEASLAGQQLIGRSLPGVCADFLRAGMQFPGLMETMAIPAHELNLEELKRSHCRWIKELRVAYDLPDENPTELLAIENCFSGDTVDFGRLELTQQMDFLRRLKAEADLRESVRDLNPAVKTIGAIAEEALEQTLENNRRVIVKHYSPAVIGKQLGGIYRTLLSSVPGTVSREPAIASAILNRFVHPSLLYPIRLES